MQPLSEIEYSRVTEVLQYYNDFSHIDPAVLRNAADRGSRVHKFCEWYAKDLLIETPDEDCLPYVNSFIKWFDSQVERVLLCEGTIYSDDLALRGTVDLVVKMHQSDEICVVDLKTPQQAAPTWRYQTAAYQLLLHHEKKIDAKRRLCVMLSKTSAMPQLLEFDDAVYDRDVFLHMLGIHKNLLRMKNIVSNPEG